MQTDIIATLIFAVLFIAAGDYMRANAPQLAADADTDDERKAATAVLVFGYIGTGIGIFGLFAVAVALIGEMI